MRKSFCYLQEKSRELGIHWATISACPLEGKVKPGVNTEKQK